VSTHGDLRIDSDDVSPLRRNGANGFIIDLQYRISEAAVYMGLSPWFIEEKIRAKELPALRLCRHYTILKEDMDAFLDTQRRAAA
jgi:excisionase family DNA binding protein